MPVSPAAGTTGLAADREAFSYVVAALRTVIDPVRDHELGPAPDVDRTVAICRHHGIVGLVHSASRRAGNGSLAEALVGDRDRAVVRGLQLTSGLTWTLDQLTTAGITSVLLKGAALAETVYSTGQRSMGDVDLLVAETHLRRADEALRAVGFTTTLSHGGARVQDEMRVEHRHLPMLVHVERQIGVELHRRALGEPEHQPLAARMIDRSRPSRQEPHRLLAPTDQLLHLACHFSDDRKWTTQMALRQLTDIALVASRLGPEIDWDLLAAEARFAEAVARVYAALRAVAVVFDIDSVGAVERLRPAGWTDEIEQTLIVEQTLNVSAASTVDMLQPHRHPLRRLFPGREVMEDRYGPPAGAVESLRRYGDRLRRGGRRVASIVRHPGRTRRRFALNQILREE